MKKLLPALLAAAVIFAPIVARADVSTNGEAASPQMMQLRASMLQLHQQERAAMLQAITPQHRSLLAQVAGQLSISVSPDLARAARTIDSALSPGEKQSVLRIAGDFKSRMRALHQSMRAQMGNQENEHIEAARTMHDDMRGRAAAWRNDPGFMLLHVALGMHGLGKMMH